MKLYGVAFSPYAQRCLMVARAKGLALPLVPPPPDGNWRSPKYRAINPLAKIPCLDDDGFLLPESGPIADYLDAILPGPPLWPEDPRQRARAMFVARMVDVEIGPGVTQLLGAMLFSHGDDSTRARAERRIAKGLLAIAHFRDASHIWAEGDRLGHVDAALMPMLVVHQHFCGAPPALGDYWDRARSSPQGIRLVDEMMASLSAFLARAPADRAAI